MSSLQSDLVLLLDVDCVVPEPENSSLKNSPGAATIAKNPIDQNKTQISLTNQPYPFSKAN